MNLTKILPGATAIGLMLTPMAQAEITVLEKNPHSYKLLAPLSLTVGGSIRPEWIFNQGTEPGYYSRGHDGGTRFRFGADYQLAPHTSLIGHYEWGVDLPHALHLHKFYDENGDRDKQRKLFGGIKDDRYGTLTFGHQFGVYYSVVGMKSDVWGNDGHAQGTGLGINGDYDGGNRPKRSLMYTNDFGPLTLTTNYLLPEDELHLNGLSYRRKNGTGLGIDYRLTPALTLSAAWSYTSAEMKNDAGQHKNYHQQLSGTALTWQPGNWYLVATASYYKDYVPDERRPALANYFTGSGYGVEGFAGYTFNFNKPLLASIQPYVAWDSLQLKTQPVWHANHVYIGAMTDFGHGVSVALEQTLAFTSDRETNSTWMTWFIAF